MPHFVPASANAPMGRNGYELSGFFLVAPYRHVILFTVSRAARLKAMPFQSNLELVLEPGAGPIDAVFFSKFRFQHLRFLPDPPDL